MPTEKKCNYFISYAEKVIFYNINLTRFSSPFSTININGLKHNFKVIFGHKL